MVNKYYLFLIFFFLFNQTIFAGLAPGTLIKCPTGFVAVEDLRVGDIVLSSNDGDVIQNKIVAIRSINDANLYEIVTPNSALHLSSFQKIYDCKKHVWVTPVQINNNTEFLDSLGNLISCLDCKLIRHGQLVYELILQSPHTFFVTRDEILLHNFAPVIGVSLSFGGKIAVESIILGLGALGIKLFKDHSRNIKIKPGTIQYLSSSAGGNPKDPDKNTKNKNREYEDAPYHHQNSKGRKSQSPKDGQAALDNSYEVSKLTNKERRIGISKNEFVVLDSHGKNKFHGHVRTWKNLEQEMKNILIKNKLVKWNGKIIR